MRKEQAYRQAWGGLEASDVGGRQQLDLTLETLDDVLRFDKILTELKVEDERAHAIVEGKVFAGFSSEEIAESLGVSSKTVQRDWTAAKAWLQSRLTE